MDDYLKLIDKNLDFDMDLKEILGEDKIDTPLINKEHPMYPLLSIISASQQTQILPLYQQFLEKSLSMAAFIQRVRMILEPMHHSVFMSLSIFQAKKTDKSGLDAASLIRKRPMDSAEMDLQAKKLKQEKIQTSNQPSTTQPGYGYGYGFPAGAVPMPFPGGCTFSDLIKIDPGMMPGMMPPFPIPGAPHVGTTPAPAADSNEVDVTKLDVDSMMDVTSYGGVNIKEEEEMMAKLSALRQKSREGRPKEDQIKVQDFLNMAALKKHTNDIVRKMGLDGVDSDFLTYLALSTQERMRELMEKMIYLSKHRTGLLHDQFLRMEKRRIAREPNGMISDLKVSVTDNVKARLLEIEREEKELEIALRAGRSEDGGLDVTLEEDKPKEKSQGEDMTEEMQKKGKKSKVDMPEEVKTRLANEAAMKAAGGPMKSWMLADSSSGIAGGIKVVPKKKKLVEVVEDTESKMGVPLSFSITPTKTPLKPQLAQKKTAQTVLKAPVGIDQDGETIRLLRPMTQKEMRRIILKDALFCIDKDPMLRKSSLLYKWNANIK